MDTLKHKCFLEELLFWTIKYEFPQKMVTFLLNMLPDQDYKVFNAVKLLHMQDPKLTCKSRKCTAFFPVVILSATLGVLILDLVHMSSVVPDVHKFLTTSNQHCTLSCCTMCY